MFVSKSKEHNFFRTPNVVEIEAWGGKELHTEGARDKYRITAPKSNSALGVIPEHVYFFKQPNTRYPQQIWSEVVAYIIATLMDIPCPPTTIALNNKEGIYGSMSPSFYGPLVDRLQYNPLITPGLYFRAKFLANEIRTQYFGGGEYMSRIIKEYDLKQGKKHNLRAVGIMLRQFQSLEKGLDLYSEFIKILVFDSVIGNTDRHHDNWGIIWHQLRNETLPRLSPAFDNGTSLGHEIMQDKLETFNNDDRLVNYIRRGRHHICTKLGAPRIAHQSVFNEIPLKTELRKNILKSLKFKNQELSDKVMALTKIDIGEYSLSPERADFMLKLTLRRKEYLLESLT